MASKFILGLDLGSKEIKAALAEFKRGSKPVLTKVFHFPSAGIRRGIVENSGDASSAIAAALENIKELEPKAIRNIILAIGAEDISTQISTGVVAVSRADNEIYEDDIQRSVQSSQAVNLLPNREVIHAIVKEFIVDGSDKVMDPLGMVGTRLEVNSLIIDSFSPNVKNLAKCVEDAGGGILELVLSPLASSTALLSKNQKELGVIVIDIGFGKTGLAIYEEQQLIHTAVIPIGSGHITNDLAIGLKIPIDTAELIKKSFASASSKSVLKKEVLELHKIDSRSKGTVNKKFISEIIEARLSEIFEHVATEIKKSSNINRLPAGAILVGGGAKLNDILDIARQELGLATEIGRINPSPLEVESPELNAELEKPENAVAIGLLLTDQLQYAVVNKQPSTVASFVKRAFNYFIP
ncbi:MAG: cell division protein FtsA [bacterium]|nr:cell division protein FtsA [bacterium]